LNLLSVPHTQRKISNGTLTSITCDGHFFQEITEIPHIVLPNRVFFSLGHGNMKKKEEKLREMPCHSEKKTCHVIPEGKIPIGLQNFVIPNEIVCLFHTIFH
jgi:hypothetical protein